MLLPEARTAKPCLRECMAVFLAGNSEVSLELKCFTAELITYIVCECDAPEWPERLPKMVALDASPARPSPFVDAKTFESLVQFEHFF